MIFLYEELITEFIIIFVTAFKYNVHSVHIINSFFINGNPH